MGKKTSFVFIVLLSLSVFTGRVIEAATFRASLDSAEIPVGGYTHLSIEIEGASNKIEIKTPTVTGLIFRRSGDSSQTSFINGRISNSKTIRFTLIGETEGIYQIPPISIIVGKESFQTQEFEITVTDNASSQQTSKNNRTQSISAEQIRQIAFLKLSVDSRRAFVGEKVPISIKLYLNTAQRFNQIGRPELENDAIMIPSLYNLEFEQTFESMGRNRYEVFEWNTSFTAVKPGSIQLHCNQEIPLLVRARQQAGRRSIFDSSFFSPSYQSLPILAKSNELEIEISSFPENPPETFTGAIGEFKLDVNASPTEIQVGDPITLHITISGKGNFDRVFHDGLESISEFKTYKPEVEFTPTDNYSLQGSKTFKQAIIPVTSTPVEIPPIHFTYLDSSTGTFKTVTSPSIAIKIEKSSNDSSSEIYSGDRNKKTTRESIDTDGLIGISVMLDDSQLSIRPFCKQNNLLIAFAATPISLAMLSFLLSLIFKRNNQASVRLLRQQSRQLKAIWAEIENSRKSANSIVFVQSAAKYSRTVLAYKWGTQAHAITSADAKSRLNNEFPSIVKILNQSEIIAYAGSSHADINSDQLLADLKTEWASLEKSLNLS